MNNRARLSSLTRLVGQAHARNKDTEPERQLHSHAEAAIMFAQDTFTPRTGIGSRLRVWINERKAIAKAIRSSERYLAKYGGTLPYTYRT